MKANGNGSTARPTGYVVYEGPSTLDGAPIVAIALTGDSTNRKTGPMMQTYILRADQDPQTAVKRGDDASICGDCPHRGDTCYVILWQGPRMVYQTYVAGKYPRLTDAAAIADLGTDRAVRLGAYGDPAAVPDHVWQALLSRARTWTGYSHQWRTMPHLRDRVMASVDSPAEAADATAQGWRYFRVRSADQPILPGEISCPASEEAGRRVQCVDCGLCKGTARAARNITIIVHGATAKRFASRCE